VTERTFKQGSAFGVNSMLEVLVRLRHDLPLAPLSKMFPKATVERWCNSVVDHLEVTCENTEECDALSKAVHLFVDTVGSSVIHESRREAGLGITFRCRCTAENSTVRMSEARGCLWKPPVIYLDGIETVSLLAADQTQLEQVVSDFKRVGEVEVTRRTSADFSTLRDVFTLSLSSLFDTLTERQLVVFLHAVNRGYYALPKAVSIQEIARDLSLSDSTVQEHLGRAEYKISRALAPYLRLYSATRSPVYLQDGEDKDPG